MNMEVFIYRHSAAYRLILGAACVALTCGGIASMSRPTSLSHHYFSSLNLALPAPPEPHEAKLARLPGSDGSSSPTNSTASNQASPVATQAIASAADLGGGPRQLGHDMAVLTFGESEWKPLDKLWTKESGWNPNAHNRWSGACGIPQALPCSKITDISIQGQVSWGLGYIQRRYGTPSNAWAHSQTYGWY